MCVENSIFVRLRSWRTGWHQPPPQALRFSHGRGERETRVTGDEPQGTMERVKTAGDLPAFLCAHIFIKRETSGYEAGVAHLHQEFLGVFSGRSRGGAHPLIFWPNWGLKKNFLRLGPFPLSHGLDDWAPPYLKVWICHSGAPIVNFRKNICSEDDLRSRIFGTFVVKFLAYLPLLGFSNT